MSSEISLISKDCKISNLALPRVLLQTSLNDFREHNSKCIWSSILQSILKTKLVGKTIYIKKKKFILYISSIRLNGPRNKTDIARPSEQSLKSAREKYFRLETPRVTHTDKNNGGPRPVCSKETWLCVDLQAENGPVQTKQ